MGNFSKVKHNLVKISVTEGKMLRTIREGINFNR